MTRMFRNMHVNIFSLEEQILMVSKADFIREIF